MIPNGNPEPEMRIHGLGVANLFGRRPDDRPMNTRIRGRDIGGADAQVFLNDGTPEPTG